MAISLEDAMAEAGQPVAERLVVLGAGPRTEALLAALRRYAPDAEAAVEGVAREAGELAALTAGPGPWRVVVGPEAAGLEGAAEALEAAASRGLRVEGGEALFERLTWRAPIDECGELWAAGLEEAAQAPYMENGKRLLDVALTVLLAVPALVAGGLAAAAVWLTSGRPVLFGQVRVGRGGREFRLWKLRTMVNGAEDVTGPVFSAHDDERVTPVGAWLRRYGIDELPQLGAVLTGVMSLVGPRPERPQFVEGFSREVPLYPKRHLVTPGLTGWAQVNLKRSLSPTDAAEKLRFDLYYLRHASLALDLQILWRTACVLLGRRRNADLPPQ